MTARQSTPESKIGHSVSVPRARPMLDPKHAKRIRAAQQGQDEAQIELRAAVLAALADGASWLAITDATGIAATTISRYVKGSKR